MVIGRQLFRLFERLLARLPFVAKVYTSVRQLLDTMMAKKESSQRVVLVDFPIPGQKCIGFLTRTLTDASTGEPLAAVLLPNAINPTSAFLQILPMTRVIETSLTMEQAMSMLLTGGAVGPETIQYSSGTSRLHLHPQSKRKFLSCRNRKQATNGGAPGLASETWVITNYNREDRIRARLHSLLKNSPICTLEGA